MTRPRLFLAMGICMLLLPQASKSQKAAVKTNVLQWSTAIPNLGFEFRLSRKSTLDLSAGYNPFSVSETKNYRLWLVQPEYRYWFCESFNGTFIGGHVHGGEFNVGGLKLPFGMWPDLRRHRYDGYFYGAGISVGHHWIISPRWGIEATFGAGYARFEFDKYRCADCNPFLKSAHKNYFGPTKAAVSFIFFIK